MPPAFNLSQDQTLQLKSIAYTRHPEGRRVIHVGMKVCLFALADLSADEDGSRK